MNMDCRKKYDFLRICRICLLENDHMMDLFQPAIDSMMISQAITLCSGVKPSDDDGFPKQICNECVSLANTVLIFKQKCENSYSKLREYILNDKHEELSIMGLNDIGDYFQYESIPTESLFPSPRHDVLIECDERQATEELAMVINTHNSSVIQFPNLQMCCEVSREKFDSEFDYNKHKSSHADLFTVGDTISCPFCVELFAKHKSQQKHIETHIELSYNKCEKCQCYFVTSGQLKRHHRISHVDSREDKDLTIDSDILKSDMCLMDDSYSFLNDIGTDDIITNIEHSNLNTNLINQQVDSAQCITDYEANKVLSEMLECAVPLVPYPKCEDKENKPEEIEECTVGDGKSHEPVESVEEIAKPKKRVYKRKKRYQSSTPKRESEFFKPKLFNCSQCTKSFTRLSAYEKHEARHQGVKNILCSECGESFYKKYLLERHIRRNHKEIVKGSFPCTMCDKIFYQSNHLKSHMRGHKNANLPAENNTYLCTTCGKKLSSNSNLHIHIRRFHTKEVTSKCQVCGMGFYRTTDLKRHMLSHTGAKSLKCSICSMAFARSDNLVQHMRTHKGEKPHICPTCNRGFSLSGDLKTHIKNKSCYFRKKQNETNTVNENGENLLIQTLKKSQSLNVTMVGKQVINKRDPKTVKKNNKKYVFVVHKGKNNTTEENSHNLVSESTPIDNNVLSLDLGISTSPLIPQNQDFMSLDLLNDSIPGV